MGNACAGALQAEYIGITWNGATNGDVGVKLSNALARYHHVPMPGVSPPLIVPPKAEIGVLGPTMKDVAAPESKVLTVSLWTSNPFSLAELSVKLRVTPAAL